MHVLSSSASLSTFRGGRYLATRHCLWIASRNSCQRRTETTLLLVLYLTLSCRVRRTLPQVWESQRLRGWRRKQFLVRRMSHFRSWSHTPIFAYQCTAYHLTFSAFLGFNGVESLASEFHFDWALARVVFPHRTLFELETFICILSEILFLHYYFRLERKIHCLTSHPIKATHLLFCTSHQRWVDCVAVKLPCPLLR